MMMMNFGMLFMMSMLMGGVSDTLDVIPSDEYWRIKNVQVTDDVLLAELAPAPAAGDISKLIDDLGEADAAVRDAAAAKIRAMGVGVIAQLQKATDADNPEIAARARKLIADVQNGGKAQQVRKLMAIRTAGEKKSAKLLPRLKELSSSKEMFVGDYASAAVAAIEGKPYARPAGTPADVWKLPSDVRAVFHMTIRGQKVATMEDLKKIPNFGPRDPNNNNAEQAKQVLDQMMRKIIEIVDQTGNIRLEGVTIGVAGNVGDKAGYVVFMVDAQYDRVAVANVLGKLAGGKSRAVGGIDVIDLEQEFSLMFPSDRQAVMVGGPREVPKPLEAIADAFKGNQSPLKQSPEMVKLLATVDTKGPLWGAMHVTPAYRQAPLFASMEWMTLSSSATPAGGMKFRFEAKGQNDAGTREFVGMVDGGVAQMKAMFQQIGQNPEAEMEGMKEMFATMKKLTDSLKVATDPTDATRASLTGEMDAAPQSLMGSFFGFMAVGAAPMRHAGPDVEVAPAVQEKALPEPVPQPR